MSQPRLRSKDMTERTGCRKLSGGRPAAASCSFVYAQLTASAEIIASTRPIQTSSTPLLSDRGRGDPNGPLRPLRVDYTCHPAILMHEGGARHLRVLTVDLSDALRVRPGRPETPAPCRSSTSHRARRRRRSLVTGT